MQQLLECVTRHFNLVDMNLPADKPTERLAEAVVPPLGQEDMMLV